MREEKWQNFLQQQQQSPMVKSGTFYPVKTIVGKDLDVGGTFNADIVIGGGLVPAGRFMIYDRNLRVMRPLGPSVPPQADVDRIIGILAQDVDSGPPGGEQNVGMVYRKGTFLLQEIEEANVGSFPGGFSATAQGSNMVEALRLKGIFFEFSWEGYSLIEFPPTPIPQIPPVAPAP